MVCTVNLLRGVQHMARSAQYIYIYIYINIGGSVRSAARLGGDRSGVHDVTLIHIHCVLLNVLSV